MARKFDDASSEYLERDSAPLTAYPFTMGCWFNSNDDKVDQTLIFLGDKDAPDEWWRIVAEGSGAGDPIRLLTRAGGGEENAASSTGYTVNTWHHACGRGVSATDRSAFIDGGSKGNDTVSLTPSNIDRVSIGRIGDISPDEFMSGSIAEAAIWNVALSDAEIAALGKGAHPFQFQPISIVSYWSLVRDDGIDWVGGFDLTAFNTPTISTHPPLAQRPVATLIAEGVPVTFSALTGTVTDDTEANIVAGGSTVILTLLFESWVAAGGTFNGERQAIINGLDSAQSESTGWNTEVRDKQLVGGVVRTSDKIVTITLDAQSAYNITATETITMTVPASAVLGSSAITSTPTFTVTILTAASLGSIMTTNPAFMIYPGGRKVA